MNNYILLNTLGVGSYGEVRLCKDRTNEKLFAIKIISKDFLKKKKSGHSDETYFEDIKREIAIMKKLLHPNILRLFEVLGKLLCCCVLACVRVYSPCLVSSTLTEGCCGPNSCCTRH